MAYLFVHFVQQSSIMPAQASTSEFPSPPAHSSIWSSACLCECCMCYVTDSALGPSLFSFLFRSVSAPPACDCHLLRCSTLGRKRLLYLGEFGDPQPPRTFSTWVLQLLSLTPRVADMATIWVWEFYQFSQTVPANFSISPTVDAGLVADMQKVNDIT